VLQQVRGGTNRAIDGLLARAGGPCLVVLAAVTLVLSAANEPLATPARVTAICTLGFIVALLHLRQAALACAVALAPLPGILVAAFLPAAHVAVPIGAATGLGVALMLADGAVEERVDAACGARQSLRRLLRVRWYAVSFVPVCALIAIGLALRAGTVGAAGIGGAAGLFSAALVVPLVPVLQWGEDAVARRNRYQEFWARLIAPLLVFAGPRYAMSGSGIGLVFFVMAVFGSNRLRLEDVSVPLLEAVGIMLAVAAIAGSALVARDWRRTVACVLAFCITVAIAIWALALGHVAVTAQRFASAAGLSGILLLMQWVTAERAVWGVSDEETAVEASQAAMERCAPSVCAAAVAGAAALLPFALDDGRVWFCELAELAAGALSTIILQPAFAIALERLAPRRATLKARYRVR